MTREQYIEVALEIADQLVRDYPSSLQIPVVERELMARLREAAAQLNPVEVGQAVNS